MSRDNEPDWLERAEEYANRLHRQQAGGRFRFMGITARALSIAFAEELEKRDKRIAALERKLMKGQPD